MSILEVIGLAAAAFVAGAINAVAGGGSLISFPALLAAGYPAKPANVTNTVAIWPGTLGGAMAYRSELGHQRTRIIFLLAPAILGALAGSALLLLTSGTTFRTIVPFLILTGVAIMVFQEPLGRFLERRNAVSTGADHVPLSLQAVVFLAAIYGGYFGAGLGVILLAFLSIMLPDDLHRSNALKGVLAMVVNGIAAAVFVFSGLVEWGPAALMAAFAVAGGYLGVGLARKLKPAWLRRVVIVYGTIAAIVLFFT